MSQQFDATPGLRLPEPTLDAHAPSIEVPPAAPERQDVQQIINSPEVNAIVPEIVPAPVQTSTPVAPASTTPAPLAILQATPSTPVVAADDKDDDAIDEEWINKAKAIVEELHSDPYRESEALNQVRTEYLRVRHNKETKTK